MVCESKESRGVAVRKKGVIGLAVISVLVIVVNALFLDRWVEKGMESFTARLVGARVEFEKVDVSIAGGRIGWEQLQVADPYDTWKNLVETGQCGFQIAVEPLFSKKFIVKTLLVHELRFNTSRETDGKLKKKKRERSLKPPKMLSKVIVNLEEELQQIPALRAEKTVSARSFELLLQEARFESPGRIASLQSEVSAVYSAWEDRLDKLRNAGHIAEIRESVSSIDVNRIDTAEEMLNTLAALNENYAQLKSVQQEVERTRSEFRKDSSRLRKNRESVDTWVQEDVQNILEQLKLPSFRSEDIGKLLFGEKIVERMKKVLRILGIVQKVRERGAKTFPEKKKAVRLAGQDIHFFDRSPRPDLWLQSAELTGTTPGGIEFQGAIQDLTSHPSVIEKPLTVDVAGNGPENRRLAVSGIIDVENGGSRSNFSVEMKNFRTAQFDLSNSAYFPYRGESGTGILNGNLEYTEKRFFAIISYSLRDFRLVPESGEEHHSAFSEEFLESLASEIESISLGAEISLTDEDFDFTLSSNLDGIITKAIQDRFEEETLDARVRIEGKVREETAGSLQKLDAVMKEGEEQTRSELESFERTLSSLEKSIDLKRDELKARLLKQGGKGGMLEGEVFRQFEHYLDKSEREEGN
jgi:uncharacterized protein (TIGR03545 family)